MDVTRNDVVLRIGIIEIEREREKERERETRHETLSLVRKVQRVRKKSRTNNRFSLYRDARALGIESFVVASSHIVFLISFSHFFFFDFSVVLLL